MSDEQQGAEQGQGRLLQLPGGGGGPVRETVELLEGLLEQARRGEVQHVMVVAYGRETTLWSVVSGQLPIRDAVLGVKLLDVRVGRYVATLFE